MKVLARGVMAALLTVAGLAAAPAALAEVPKLLKQVPPEYPRGAERRGIEGFVTAALTIDASGKVSAVGVVEAEPAGVFDSAVENAVKQWKFEKGKPIEKVQITLEFKL